MAPNQSGKVISKVAGHLEKSLVVEIEMMALPDEEPTSYEVEVMVGVA